MSIGRTERAVMFVSKGDDGQLVGLFAHGHF
jgi:hypothetical protein